MVRTKKHFRPPSSSSSSSESSDGEDDDFNKAAVTSRGRGKQLGNFGGGKQLSMARPGGGKQLSMAPPDDDSSDDDDDDVQAAPPQQTMPRGMGKQLQPPPPPRDDDDDDDDSDSSDDSVPQVPVGSGKRLGGMSGGGKQLRRQSANVEEDDYSSDDSDDDAPWEVAAANRGQGKMLRPSPNKKKEESDMDESSEEEEEEEVKKPAASAAASSSSSAAKPPIFDDSDESEPEPAPPKRRGRPPRAAATRASARAKTAKKVMSSDSDSDSSEEELELDFETFDTQKLVQNEDDKKYLDSLPELEREAILAERFDELKKQADIKKALRENKRREREAKKAAEGGQKKKKTPAKKKAAATKSKKAPPKKKQKVADDEGADDSSEEEEEAIDTSADAAIAASLSGKRVSARNLVKKGKQFKKQAALAKIRESRANKKVEEESDSDLDYGRDSDDSDDDYEEMKPWQKTAKKKATTQLQAAESSDESMVDLEEEDKDEPVKRTEDAEAEQEDYAKVSIPRRRLIRWCSEPYFVHAIKNFYVRIGIGRDNKTQKACYRLCKIEGIVEKDAYTFPASEGQKAVTTDKWLSVSFGKQKREFKMLTVSDHRPTVDDVTKYVGHLKNERGSHALLTKKKANKLRKKQDELVNNYTYTKEDIEMLVKEKKKRNKKSANIGLEKTRVAIAVRAAEDAVKEVEKQLTDAEVERMEADTESEEMVADEKVNELKKALEEANNNLKEAKAEQNRIMKEDEERSNKLKQNSKIQNWDKVNQRAKLANQSADFAAYKEQRAREKAEGSAEPKFDPYARRKVKPKNLWEVKGAKSDEAAEATVEEEKKETGALVERDDSNATKEVDKENKRDDNPDSQKNDLPASNQFAYDDDIMIGGDIANLAGIGVKKTTTRIRQGISLEDYQSRKAAGTL